TSLKPWVTPDHPSPLLSTNTHTHTHTHKHTVHMHTDACAHIHARTHRRTCTHSHTRTQTHTHTHTHIMKQLHYYLIIGSCPPLVLYATGAPAHKHTVHHWSACWKAALGNQCTSTAAAMSWPW